MGSGVVGFVFGFVLVDSGAQDRSSGASIQFFGFGFVVCGLLDLFFESIGCGWVCGGCLCGDLVLEGGYLEHSVSPYGVGETNRIVLLASAAKRKGWAKA